MGRLSFRMAFLTLLCGSLCTGCAQLSDFVKSMFGEEPVEEVPPEVYDGPRVKPGVALKVQVSVVGQDPVVMEQMVDENGYLTLPYLLPEPVECNNIKLDSLRKKLTKAYQEYILQPQVNVSFAPFDQKTGVSPYGTVKVMGRVADQGPVNMPSTMDLTVTKAIQAAGGLKSFANSEKIKVTHLEKDGTRTVTFVNLIEIGEEGRADKDIVLQPGDVVNVPELRW